MPETTPNPVPSPAPKESGGVGATPSAEAVEEFLMVPKVDDAGLSGRWGHQHTAPIPEGLAGLGARGQEPVAPGLTVLELREEIQSLKARLSAAEGANVRFLADSSLAAVTMVAQSGAIQSRRAAEEALAQLAAVTAERDRWKAGAQAMAGVGLEWLGSAGSVAEQLAAVQAERDYERKRANEAIAQLHDAQRELAALRVRVADGGKVVKG